MAQRTVGFTRIFNYESFGMSLNPSRRSKNEASLSVRAIIMEKTQCLLCDKGTLLP